MVDRAASRKTHITRILGTNKNGDVLRDLWADLERIEQQAGVDQEHNYQVTMHRYRWRDDPGADDYLSDGNPGRNVEIIKLCAPDQNPEDPDEWIPIPAIRSVQGVQSGEFGNQVIVRRHRNNETNQSRSAVARRITHKDTSIDDRAQAAFDADPDRKAFVVASDQYEKLDGTEDAAQYLEAEIVRHDHAWENETTKTGQGNDQGRVDRLISEYLINDSSVASDPPGPLGINPPWRLDPLQNIVNVQFGGRLIFVWFSGDGRDVPASGYYRTLTGSEKSGSFDFALEVPPNFTRKDPPFNPTDAQTATANGVAGLAQDRFMSGALYLSTPSTIYEINRDGAITRTIDVQPYTAVIPPNFNTDPTISGPAPDNNVPFVFKTWVVVVGGIVYLAFQINGRSIPDPSDEPQNYTLLSAVGYVAIDRNDVAVKSDLIAGPNIGASYTDNEHNVHTFRTAAFAGEHGLYLGKFNS